LHRVSGSANTEVPTAFSAVLTTGTRKIPYFSTDSKAIRRAVVAVLNLSKPFLISRSFAPIAGSWITAAFDSRDLLARKSNGGTAMRGTHTHFRILIGQIG